MDAVNIWIIILLALIFPVLLWIGWQLRKRGTPDSSGQLENSLNLLKADLINRQTQSLHDLRDSIDNTHKVINDRLAEGTSTLDRRMSVLGDIENRLGKLATQTDNIEQVGKNIQSLSQLLKPPNLRGSLGELLLEKLLSEILPADAYDTQYSFSDGLRVDAIIKLGEKIIPIDAKFPMESYQRLTESPDDPALQKEFNQTFKPIIKDIAKKYIRPHEGTTEFGLMYIPSESVYYQLISQKNLEGFEYALDNKVIPSSPGHLYAFLASITRLYAEISLAGKDITDDTRNLLAEFDKLLETSERLEQLHQKMSGSLRGFTASFDRAKSEVENLQTDLTCLREPYGEQE